jgi:hypothetical protein
VHLVDEQIDVFAANHFLGIGTADVIRVLDAADVLPGDAHNDIFDFVTRIVLGFKMAC